MRLICTWNYANIHFSFINEVQIWSLQGRKMYSRHAQQLQKTVYEKCRFVEKIISSLFKSSNDYPEWIQNVKMIKNEGVIKLTWKENADIENRRFDTFFRASETTKEAQDPQGFFNIGSEAACEHSLTKSVVFPLYQRLSAEFWIWFWLWNDDVQNSSSL